MTDAVGPIRLTPRPSGSGDGACRSLDGTWRLAAAPPDAPPTRAGVDWRRHEVPGEWEREGYDVDEEAGQVGWYRRELAVPADWTGRVLLRAEAAYSHAAVWLDGERLSSHEGGYTPFEVDLTESVAPGHDHDLVVAVREESRAAELDWGNVGGGLTRGVDLLAVPDCHLADLRVETALEPDGEATVDVAATVANRGDAAADATLDLALDGPGDARAAEESVTVEALAADAERTVEATLELADPATWHPEHPDLYDLTATLATDDGTATVERRVGVREVTVEGDQLLCNGDPVTLRGVNWEETDADAGHAIDPTATRRALERLRDANVTFLRPHCHPPTRNLLDACDELGILVEVECPFTFVRGDDAAPADDPAYRDTVVRGALETVAHARGHPSTLLWSLANESDWGENFAAAARAVRDADPTRPTVFNWAEYRDADNCPVGAHHYPAMRTPGSLATGDFHDRDRPVVFDEACHLYCYDVRELLTDPGLREEWGRHLEATWEAVRAADSAPGMAIFSGVDHTRPTFRWGLLDAHRRGRPELFHVSRVYSPVRATAEAWHDDAVTVAVENRHDVTDLAACRLTWAHGEASGTVEAAAPPGETARVRVPCPGDAVRVRVSRPGRGRLTVARFERPAADPTPSADPVPGVASPDGDGVTLTAGDATWRLDEHGRVVAPADGDAVLRGAPVPATAPVEPGDSGPHERATPFEHRPAGWSASVTADDGAVVAGAGEDLSGEVRLTALDDGWAEIIEATPPTDGDAVAASDIARRTIASETNRAEHEVEKTDAILAGLAIQYVRDRSPSTVVVLTDDKPARKGIKNAAQSQGYEETITVYGLC